MKFDNLQWASCQRVALKNQWVLCVLSHLLMSLLHQWNQRIYSCKNIDSNGWKYRNLQQESTIRLHSHDIWCSFSGQTPHLEQLTFRDSTLPMILYTYLFSCEFSLFPSLWALFNCIKPTTFEMITQTWVNMTPATVSHTILIMEIDIVDVWDILLVAHFGLVC